MVVFEKVYNDFVSYTGLTDSVYRSVFSNIFGILDKVKNISWNSLEYKDSSGGSSVFDFTKSAKIQRYVVELFQNVFKNYYTLPAKSEVIINVSVNDIEYKIINSGDTTSIPSDLDFIKKYHLYDMFILSKPVYDLFSAFDDEFCFTENFKNTVQTIFQPLKRRFDKIGAEILVREENLSPNKIADIQLNVEGLRNRIKELLERLDIIRQDRDKVTISRNKIFSGVNSREGLLSEREKYVIEHDTLKETKKDYEIKLEKLVSMINEIDAELSDLLANNANEKDTEYLRTKKVLFEKDKFSLEKSISDFTGFLTDLDGRIRTITATLTEVEEYSTNDIETIDKQIKAYNVEQDDLYSILIGLESELKHQQKELDISSISIEKAQSYSDMTIQNVENSAIISHLSSSLHPTPVTTVVNYMRYYFAYNATQLANSILSERPDMDTYLAQAVAVKLSLVKNFGIYMNQLFSAVDFADNRIAKIILIVKD